VRSSTSSFERTVPQGRWGATWLVALLVAVVVVVQFERFIRSRHYQPSIKDDEYAWAWQRASIANDSPRTLALLGSSRIMLGFSPAAFAEALPSWRYAQLGINGTTPIGALHDLARDEHFKGIALVDVSEPAFYQESWPSQAKYVTAYHRRWRAIGAMVERVLATEVQSRLALLATRGVGTFGKWLQTGQWPKPPYVVTLSDRSRVADWSVADAERQRRARAETFAKRNTTQRDPTPWLADALRSEPAIAQIQARGGHVVYVRMPTCDERWAGDELAFPQAQFWDPLAARTRAITIHFKDYPELSKFECPDTSHIESKDAPEFTRALLGILERKGVIARASR
jgi:hypothetical protein